MKNGLLSIGEFAKLRGINVKSLRYYESIGALLPAYVNPESGYRYYSINQLSDLDVVLTLIELGIPLKTIAQYTGESASEAADGTLELIEQGKKLARQRIERAQAQLMQLENYANEMTTQASLAEADEPYTREMERRLALCVPLDPPFDMKAYSVTDELYRLAPSVGLVPLYTQGVIYDPEDTLATTPRNATAKVDGASIWAFLSAKPLPDSGISTSERRDVLAGKGITLATLPAGTFSCRKIKAQNFDECFEAGLECLQGKTALTILAEAWTVAINPMEFTFEAQEFLE